MTDHEYWVQGGWGETGETRLTVAKWSSVLRTVYCVHSSTQYMVHSTHPQIL
jgi:hypothetical protein